MSLPAAPADEGLADPPGDAPVRFGKYRLQRLLARGGMGEVYLARLVGELGFEKPLVIKTILPRLAANPKFIELFAAEAKTAVALSHGNIVPTYELGRADDTFYIVMGYVDGPSVAQFLQAQRRTEQPVELALALHVIRGVLAGLAYAHREGPGRTAVVHRDITPRNVLIDRSGQVRIVDFGIAAPARQQTGIRAGSIGYIAPEQARGATPDPRADVFSVGCLLYELCTLERAFPKEDVWEVPDFAGIPSEVRTVIEDALCLDPEGRPANGRDMLQRLRPALIEHAGAFEDPELAGRLRALFPDGWESVGSSDGSAPLRAFDGENQTFATRLTEIEAELQPEADAAASLPGADAAGSRQTSPDSSGVSGASAASVSLSAGSSQSHAGTPNRQPRTIALLLLGAAAIGGVAFAVGRSDAGSDQPPSSPATAPLTQAAETAPLTQAAEIATSPTPDPANVNDPATPLSTSPSDTAGEQSDPAAPTEVTFAFAVDPPDAVVILGEDELSGGSPYTVMLAPEKIVQLTMSKRGYATKSLKVNPAQPLPDKYTLERPRPKEPGFLRISAPSVSWAEVRIDGKKVGTTPIAKLSVPAGRHRLEVVCIPDACPTTRTLLSKSIIVEAGALERVSAGS